MNNSKQLAAARADLVRQIDEAIAAAQVNPALENYRAAEAEVQRLQSLFGAGRYDEMTGWTCDSRFAKSQANRYIRTALEARQKAADAVKDPHRFVTFAAPGVGRFKVLNLTARLREFRGELARSSGFTYRKPVQHKAGWLPEGRKLPAQGPMVPPDEVIGEESAEIAGLAMAVNS